MLEYIQSSFRIMKKVELLDSSESQPKASQFWTDDQPKNDFVSIKDSDIFVAVNEFSSTIKLWVLVAELLASSLYMTTVDVTYIWHLCLMGKSLTGLIAEHVQDCQQKYPGQDNLAAITCAELSDGVELYLASEILCSSLLRPYEGTDADI
ncbi:hypothetical protein C5167_037792 [Papaver somniferum]|uniref:Uncharacterized protein n=1 Tax=Papaver somniferum TaxID=3469 RepID=A0A4Y7I7E2_PAPSO|nr:hypothetical protein C5167_037792 [Papaver somniferum]